MLPLPAHGTYLHRTSGTGRGSAIHCPGPQHRRHRQVRTAGGCPTLAAPSPQPQTGHTLMTPVFLGADQGIQGLPRAAAPHPHVLKVISSSEATLSVERATAGLLSGFQAPVFSAVLSPGLWNPLTAHLALAWIFSAWLVSPSLPQPQRWPVHTLPLTFGHILFCFTSLKLQDFWAPQTALKGVCTEFHKDRIASAGG